MSSFQTAQGHAFRKFILSTMQAGITPIFNVFGMTGPSTNQESNPQILLASAGSHYCCLLTSAGATEGYLSPGSSISSPHPVPPRGNITTTEHGKVYHFADDNDDDCLSNLFSYAQQISQNNASMTCIPLTYS